MSLDLGELSGLATAVGLLDADGNPVESWFSDPGEHLSRVLANPVQRAALVSFLDEILGGSEATVDAEGTSWLPIVEVDEGTFRLFVTLREENAGARVRVGVGTRLRVSTDGIQCDVDAHIPLFAASGTETVTDPLLLGKRNAPIDLTLNLRLPPGTAQGRVDLAAIELAARIPTNSADEPSIHLALRGLRMPGAAAPRDLVVNAESVDQLDDALIELVLGLIEAQVAALPTVSPQLAGFASILGLAADAVPDFPVADLLARGPVALADWFAAALTGPARQDWVSGLATLLGGNVINPGTPESAVEVNIAGAPLRIELRLTPGAASRPIVTARLSTGIAGGPGARLAFIADLVSIDLGTGAPVALPRLAVTGRLDPPGPAKLLPPLVGPAGLQVAVGALEVGFALDASRRPVLVVNAEDADVGATHYDVLDLSTPEALAAVAGQAVADAATAVLQALGPAGAAVAILLGLDSVPGAPASVDPGELLRDPVAAVRDHWHNLVTAHAAAVPAVLATLRDAIADSRVRATAIGGDGSEATPWRVPVAPQFDLLLIANGNQLRVAIESSVSADLGTTAVRAELAVRIDVVRLNLGTGDAAFLPNIRASLMLRNPAGERLRIGAAGISASLAAFGIAVAWSPDAGIRVEPITTDARVQGLAGDITIPPLTIGSDGRLVLHDAGWSAVEQLVGTLAFDLALRTDMPWLATVVSLIGWVPAAGSVDSGNAPLSLSALIADPRAALESFGRSLMGNEDALRAALEALASVLVSTSLDGIGASGRPWIVPLVAPTGSLAGRSSSLLPGLTVALDGGAAATPLTSVSEVLRAWQPGDDGLDPNSLIAALTIEGDLDDELADLVADRGDLVQGLIDLEDRWAATDGLVTLPDEGALAGLTAHRPAELLHDAPLTGTHVTEVLDEIWAAHFGGAAPATLVFVAIEGDDRHGAPRVLPEVGAALPADRSIDLTSPGLPPEAFVAPAAGAAGMWAIRLGSRAACRLPDGHAAGPDPDGIAGQAARLRRVLTPIAGAGADVAVIAHGGAGHAAVRAVSGLAGVRGVIMIGTPWSPVSVDSLDAVPAGEALRLLAALIRIIDAAAADSSDPATEPDDPDDLDLALGRSVVAALLDLDPFVDPLGDIRPPGSFAAPAGIPVHAVVGSIAPPALRRAFTAVIVAGVAARARLRAAAPPPPSNAQARAGIHLPLVVGGAGSGLVATIQSDVDVVSVSRDGAATLNGPGVRVRIDLGATSGWLAGGPDPGRASGGARVVACRRLSATVSLPIRSWNSTLTAPAPHARLVLHEAQAFGTVRNRWVVEAGPGASTDATTLLPEVRAILAEVASRMALAAATDPAIAALSEALAALGVVGPDGGFDSITLERLLLDPEPTVAAARGDATRRQRLAAAVRSMAGDTRAVAVAQDSADLRYGSSGEVVAHVDFAAPSLTVTSAAPAGSVLAWAIGVTASPAGASATFRVGNDLPAASSTTPGPPGFAVVATASAGGLTAELRQRGAGGTETVALWPAPSADAVLDLLTTAVPAVTLRVLLEALRSTLGSSPTGLAIDALLQALGVLGPDPGDGSPRMIKSLMGIVADPAAWLQNIPAGLPGSVPALVDALRGLIGAGGTAGTLRIADGVTVRTAMQGPRLLVAIDVDASGFIPPAGGLLLTLAGGLGLSISTTALGTTLPDVSASFGIAGAGAIRLRVGPDAGGAGNTVGVTLSLAPTGRPEIRLLPGGPGLAGLADAAAAGAIAALPALLDAIADLNPTGAPTTPGEIAGRVITRLGDALALRTGAPARFDQAALVAFGNDPAAALAARAASLGGAGLTLLTEAVGPLLGGVSTRSVTTADGALVVTLEPVTVRWRPGTSTLEAAVALSGVPGIDHLAAELAVGPTGLALLDVTVGPAVIDAGVVTLAPYARVAVGAARAEGNIVEVGLGVGANRRLAFRWNLTEAEAGLLAIEVGSSPTDLTESQAPAAIAIAVVGAVIDLAGGVVLSVGPVHAALGQAVLGTTVGDLLDGVLLAPGRTDRIDPALAGELADPVLLLRRVARLAGNLAAAPNAAIPIADVLVVRITRRDEGATAVFGLNVSVDGSWELNPDSDIVVSLEEDVTWIQAPGGPVPEGLTVEFIDLPPTGPPNPRPGLVVGGLGVRIARSSGPLIDAGITIGSIAVHFFGSITSAGSTVNLAGGVQLELAALGVGLAGASGGDNAVAQGVMGQSGPGEDAPAPRFSPAVALQKHPSQPLRITLRAGPGSGPWWLTIQREFGPIYLEQIGFAVVNPPSGIESVGILIDGRVSLMGLSASVDDLSLTYIVSGGGSALDPSKWRVDLAGFAIAADISGLSLAGGLRKFTPPQGGVEYLGMLMARVAVYGLTVYGGYGLVGPEGDQFTSLFLFGAVNGPIGGPPAFFIMGIGGGFGINRRLSVPQDMSRFGNFPMIKALDPAARAGDPFEELAEARVFFAPERGTFWFAAGVAFNSFALVDGVAVLAIQIGNGFELSLLGLARMALPRPQAALLSIELALIARFSTREGIILVQGQLTDNSWLLMREVRLTGGFAFAAWFAGPNRGQFVVTIGGYHPDFHRDGYPIVPRLGIAVNIGDFISIVGGSYFALTSEAVMAGVRLEISATLGPAWAHIVFGGDAIIFFDPFQLKVTVYASIDAGVTIDLWFAEITISVHLSARIELTAPPLHVVARFEIGPVGLTFEFGESVTEPRYIPWDAFVVKYLEEAAPGRARVTTAVSGAGSVPPSGSSTSGGDKSPDGTPDRPFRVVAEFEMTITSTAPLRGLVAGGPRRDLAASRVVSVAPMGLPGPADILLTCRMVGPPSDAIDRIARLEAVPQQFGAFPIGTWGLAPDPTHPTVPSGDVISATDRVLLRAVAEIPGTRPGEAVPPAIPYRQVETGARRFLPFVVENSARRAEVAAAIGRLAGFIPDATTATERFDAAITLLAERGGRSATEVAAWRRERSAVPLLGSLGEGLGRVQRSVDVVATAPPAPPTATLPRPPQLRALLVATESSEPTAARLGGDEGPALSTHTTVSERLRDETKYVVGSAPKLADIDAGLLAAVPARLLRYAPPVVAAQATVIAAVALPLTRTVRSGVEIATGRTTAAATRRGLTLDVGRLMRDATGEGAHVNEGEIAVFELQDASRDVDASRRPSLILRRGRARVIALGPAGGVAFDRIVSAGSSEDRIVVPPATRGLVVVGLSEGSSGPGEVSGWVSEVPLPSATDGVLVAAGCVVDAVGRVPTRGVASLRSGWVAPDDVIAGESAVTTTFAAPIGAVAIALEGGTGPDFALGVDGAKRPIGPDQAPEAPVLVSDRNRSVLVYRLVKSQPGTSVTVTTGAARRLAGIVAVPVDAVPEIDPAAALAAAIASGGLAAVVPPVANPGPGGADFDWEEGLT
jgi:hypothetical protein